MSKVFDCLFLLVASYLTNEEQLRFKLISSYYSKLYMKDLVQPIRISSSQFYSCFLSNPSYREAILHKLTNLYQQLNIQFTQDTVLWHGVPKLAFRREKKWSISPCHSFHSLIIDYANFYYYFYQNKQLERIYSLLLYPEERISGKTLLTSQQMEEILVFLAKRNVPDDGRVIIRAGTAAENVAAALGVSYFNVHSLDLLVLELHSFKNLQVFPFIPSLSSLKLNKFPLMRSLDVKYLTSSVKKLELHDCDSLVDVSMLDSIYDLTLNRCKNLVDISCLNHNYSIKVTKCPKIFDYSKCFRWSRLINMDFLALFCEYSNSSIMLDISNYWEVRSLWLSDLPDHCVLNFPNTLPSFLRNLKISFIKRIGNYPSSFQNLHEISIIGCDTFPPFEMLINIPIITIFEYSQSSCVALGPRNRSFSISESSNIVDFSFLRFCHTVIIDRCDKFSNISDVSQVQSLAIHSCNELISLKGLSEGAVKSLTIDQCRGIKSWEGIENIPYLHVRTESMKQMIRLKNYLKTQLKIVLDISLFEKRMLPDFMSFLFHFKWRYDEEYDTKRKQLIYLRKKGLLIDGKK